MQGPEESRGKRQHEEQRDPGPTPGGEPDIDPDGQHGPEPEESDPGELGHVGVLRWKRERGRGPETEQGGEAQDPEDRGPRRGRRRVEGRGRGRYARDRTADRRPSEAVPHQIGQRRDTHPEPDGHPCHGGPDGAEPPAGPEQIAEAERLEGRLHHEGIAGRRVEREARHAADAEFETEPGAARDIEGQERLGDHERHRGRERDPEGSAERRPRAGRRSPARHDRERPHQGWPQEELDLEGRRQEQPGGPGRRPRPPDAGKNEQGREAGLESRSDRIEGEQEAGVELPDLEQIQRDAGQPEAPEEHHREPTPEQEQQGGREARDPPSAEGARQNERGERQARHVEMGSDPEYDVEPGGAGDRPEPDQLTEPESVAEIRETGREGHFDGPAELGHPPRDPEVGEGIVGGVEAQEEQGPLRVWQARAPDDTGHQPGRRGEHDEHRTNVRPVGERRPADGRVGPPGDDPSAIEPAGHQEEQDGGDRKRSQHAARCGEQRRQGQRRTAQCECHHEPLEKAAPDPERADQTPAGREHSGGQHPRPTQPRSQVAEAPLAQPFVPRMTPGASDPGPGCRARLGVPSRFGVPSRSRLPCRSQGRLGRRGGSDHNPSAAPPWSGKLPESAPDLVPGMGAR